MTASQPKERPVELNPYDEIDSNLLGFINETHYDRFISLASQKQIVGELQAGDEVGAKDARQQLIATHLGLVAAVAFDYRTESSDATSETASISIMEEGTNGLLIAARTYDQHADFSDHAVTIIGKYLREGSFEESDFETDHEAMSTRPTEELYQMSAALRISSKTLTIKRNTRSQKFLAKRLGLEDLQSISVEAFADLLTEDEQKILQMAYLADTKMPPTQMIEELGITIREFKKLKRLVVKTLADNIHRL